jgi:hypothetical protein
MPIDRRQYTDGDRQTTETEPYCRPTGWSSSGHTSPRGSTARPRPARRCLPSSRATSSCGSLPPLLQSSPGRVYHFKSADIHLNVLNSIAAVFVCILEHVQWRWTPNDRLALGYCNPMRRLDTTQNGCVAAARPPPPPRRRLLAATRVVVSIVHTALTHMSDYIQNVCWFGENGRLRPGLRWRRPAASRWKRRGPGSRTRTAVSSPVGLATGGGVIKCPPPSAFAQSQL